MEIKQLLDGIESKEMVMPEFQREYIWPIEDAKQLIISIFKGYPTGCLLFWGTENPPEIKNEAVDRERLGLTKVILDGQQRLTTLYLLTKGDIPPYYREVDILNDPRHLYFNVFTGDFQFYVKTKMEKNPLWQGIIDCFNDEKVDAFDIAEKYLGINEEADFKNSIKMINANLSKIRRIEKVDYPILKVSKSANIDDAIDVFDRVNSQGTKLTDAELVLTHITGRWSHARRVMKEKINELKDKGFNFDLDFMTRCMVVTLTDSALYKRNSQLKYENFSKDNYVNSWEKVSKSLDYLIPILQQDGLISSTNDLNTNNVLVPLIAYLVKNDIRFIGNSKFKFLHWMFLALIWGRYSGQTDQRLDKDVHILYNSEKPVQGLIEEIQDQRGRLEVKASDLEGRGAGHALYKMLYIITKANKAIDWANGGAIYGTIGDYYSIQSHHIFPRSYLYKNGYESDNHLHRKRVNEIANRAFITRDTNYSISDRPPYEYLHEIENEYNGALKKQFIPKNKELWTIENYEKFLEERREIIAENINGFLSDLESKELNGEITKKLDWVDIINKGENNFVEFKSSLRYCYREEEPMKYIEKAIIKTINAFLNSEGGKLFVGIDDEGNILGLKNDFKTFGGNNSKDKFQLKFDNIIRDNLGNENITDIRVQFIKIDDKDIFLVEVQASSQPVFMKDSGKEEFYVRASASSQPYGMREALDYIERHWS